MSQDERKIQKFLAEYGKLTKEHGVDFISYPVYVPDKDGGFTLRIQTQPIAVEDKTEKFIPE